ncbi:type 4a pilus biogenesis protein PilO [Desulfotomaculum sp. 1211_IL3151]|uniref:type 4a pilus biogenesis protein PilO n=1 Tax=Desulfotomaculum sp. 1211_IL3151 TaxID=3084055 RepID=UPI002FDB366D
MEKQINQYFDLETRLQGTQQELAKASKVLAEEKKQRELAVAVDNKLKPMISLVDTRLHKGDALAYLNWQADQNHTHLQDLKPLQVVDKKHYLEMPFTLKVQGTYQDVVNYIKVLESLPNISEIRRAEFRPLDKEVRALAGEAIITAELDLVVFSVKEGTRILDAGKELSERWQVGRDNAFQGVEPLSPLEGMTIPNGEPSLEELIGN